jgi:photosystem II stability/assembly factor-like uncharacterized protein
MHEVDAMKYRGFYQHGLLVGTLLTIIFLLAPDFTQAQAVTSSADGWLRLSDPVAAGGVITHLVTTLSNPNILYVLQAVQVSSPVSQRLYRSQDGGASWQIMPSENHIFTSLAVDPQDPDMLFATENDHLWKSTDAGQNWKMLYPFGRSVVVPTSGRIYLIGWESDNPCVYTSEFARSLDGGESWERSSLGCGEIIDQIFVTPANPDQIFVTSSEKALNDHYSLDGGITWQPLLVVGNFIPVTDMTFDLENPNRAYLASREIWTTENNGDTWSQCGLIPDPYPFKLLAVDDRVYAMPKYSYLTAGPMRYIYQSEDHCATWWKSIHGLPATVNSLAGDARSPERILAATGGYGIYFSQNGGATWQESNNGLSSPVWVSKLAVAPDDPNVILAGSGYPRPGVYRSNDGGVTWSPTSLDIEPFSILIHPLNPQKVWISAKDGIYTSEDSIHWSHEFYIGPVNDLAVFPGAPDTPYAVLGDGEHGSLLHFCQVPPFYYWRVYPVADSNDSQVLAVNPQNENDLLVGGTAETDPYTSQPVIYHSLDGGQSWHQVYSSFDPVIDIAVDPNNPQNRYLLTGKLGIQHSTDGGETWMDWSEGTFIFLDSSSSLAIDDFGGVYVFTWDAIYYRAKDDSDWQIVSQSIRRNSIGALWRGDAPFLLSAGWDGLWKKELAPIQKIWLPVLTK